MLSPVATINRNVAVSGRYVRRRSSGSRLAPTVNVASADTLNLDVDGNYPLTTASGLVFPSGTAFSLFGPDPFYWFAGKLTQLSATSWTGRIIDRMPDNFTALSAFPYTDVKIEIEGAGWATITGMRAILTFLGQDMPDDVRTLSFESPWFHAAQFEFDHVAGVGRVTSLDTSINPDRPPGLPLETLTVAKVYDRAGIDLTTTLDPQALPYDEADPIWTERELHDAMRVYWSHYQPFTRWAGWTLFCQRFEDPAFLGIMFDNADLGPGNRIQRQGAAIFVEKIFDDDKSPAYHRRQVFFGAVHEMGHCFNLSHSWQKQLGTSWISMGNDPGALSFMNYPQLVTRFWENFEFRFDDGELYFLRHAPPEDVMMGGLAGANHGLTDAAAGSPLKLELSVAQEGRLFDFLEPVRLQLKLINTSREPVWFDRAALVANDALSLQIEPRGSGSSTWRAYSIRCSFAAPQMLAPGQSLSHALFVSASAAGWALAEPGSYRLHARLGGPDGVITAEPLDIRIAHPRSRLEERLAQDVFTDEVGRVLAFQGSRVMAGANATLQRVVEQLGDSAVARHAAIALALPMLHPGKVLRLPEGRAPMASAACTDARFDTVPAYPDKARELIKRALRGEGAAATLGAAEAERYRALAAAPAREPRPASKA